MLLRLILRTLVELVGDIPELFIVTFIIPLPLPISGNVITLLFVLD
jgi:hypothetical protein